MPITYDAPSDTITVTGYTQGSPCTFEDIYEADVAGGWGQVSKQGINQYLLEALLCIGDGSTETWFADENVQVLISGPFPRWAKYIEVKDYAHLRFGAVKDSNSKTGQKGVSYRVDNAGGGGLPYYISRSGSSSTLELYDTHMSGGVYLEGGGTIWGCTLYGWLSGGSWDVHRTNIGTLANGVSNVVGTFDDIFIYSVTTAYHKRYGTEDLEVSNLKVRDATRLTYLESFNGTLSFIDADTDTWEVGWRADWPSDGKVYRKYTFDAHCQDKDGNDLSGVSAVGEYIDPYGEAFSLTTDANGDIATQTVDRSWYEQATGSTENMKTPLKVSYSKPGYQTVVKYYDMAEKTKDVVVLHKAVGIFQSFGSPVVNLKKTDPENKNVLVL